MPWFKVDDHMHSSRKIKCIPKRDRLAAIGLWTLAGSWSSQELTEGFIPAYMLEELGGTPRLAQALCDARAGSAHGLWKACEGGWQFHDWDSFNPSKEKVLDEREKARERQQRARDKARQKRVTEASRRDDGVTNGVTSPLVTEVSQEESRAPRPDPTRPDPKEEESGPRKRGTRVKEDWIPSEATRAKMREEYPSVDFRLEHEKFIDYWMAATGKNAVKLDWDRVWCNWIRNAATTYAPRHLRAIPGGSSYGSEPEVINGPPPELQREGGLFD